MVQSVKKIASLVVVVLLAGIAASGYGLQVGATFDIGNLAFRHDRASSDTSFAGTYYPWGIALTANQELSQNLELKTKVAYNDPILRNIVSAVVTYQGTYFTVGAGPFFGLFNSLTDPLNPGIVTRAKIQLPGVVYLSYSNASSLGGALVQPGDYFEQQSEVSLGAYVPNAIVSANVQSWKYSQKTSAGDTVDERTLYSLKTNIFQKAVPYRVLLTFGYQTLSKTFIAGSTTTVDQLGSLILGTRVEVNIGNSWSVVTDLQSGLYTFGQKALVGISNPGPFGYLFHLSTGIRLSL